MSNPNCLYLLSKIIEINEKIQLLHAEIAQHIINPQQLNFPARTFTRQRVNRRNTNNRSVNKETKQNAKPKQQQINSWCIKFKNIIKQLVYVTISFKNQ